MLIMNFYCYSAIFVHCSLGGVLIDRRSGFGEQKPQIWSGPSPCFDKDGVMKFVSLSVCKGPHTQGR